MRIAQPRFRQSKIVAALVNFVESDLGFFGSGGKRRREDATDALQRKRREAPVFAHCRDTVKRARDRQSEALAAAPDGDNPTRLDDFVQPTLTHLAASVRSAFKQTRTRTCQPFKSEYRFN